METTAPFLESKYVLESPQPGIYEMHNDMRSNLAHCYENRTFIVCDSIITDFGRLKMTTPRKCRIHHTHTNPCTCDTCKSGRQPTRSPTTPGGGSWLYITVTRCMSFRHVLQVSQVHGSQSYTK